MFFKTNQGLGRTNRNKKKKDKITKPKPNQTKPKRKKKKEEEERVTPPKTCALILMMVYANQRKVGEQPTFHQFLTLVI